jgi:hypothetical protein
MARKAAAASKDTRAARQRSTRKRSATGTDAHATPASKPSAATPPPVPDFGDLARMAKLMTPAQAIELYRANAALALEVINTAIENTARLRRKQFEGEEEAREFQRRHARSAAEARDPQSLLKAGQGAAQEAMEKSMHYWSEMFDLIVEMQKRLFTLLEEQMPGVPGAREAKAAMAMLPDLGQMRNLVLAMQGVVKSGGSTFESMQRVMADFAKIAQGATGADRR